MKLKATTIPTISLIDSIDVLLVTGYYNQMSNSSTPLSLLVIYIYSIFINFSIDQFWFFDI